MNPAWLILVMLLGSPDFRTRERAHAALQSNITIAIPFILEGERSDDPEIRERCRLLAAPWFVANADKLLAARKPPWWKAWPWIECLGGDDGPIPWDVYQHYLGTARGLGFADHGPDWPAWSEATRLMLRDRVAARLPIEEIAQELRDRERKYRRKR